MERGSGNVVAESSEHMNLGLVDHCSLLGPASGDVGDIQGVGIHPPCTVSAVCHQIHLDETRAVVVPFAAHPDGDLVLEQGTELGGCPAMREISLRLSVNSRSIVAGDIRRSLSSTSSPQWSSP